MTKKKEDIKEMNSKRLLGLFLALAIVMVAVLVGTATAATVISVDNPPCFLGATCFVVIGVVGVEENGTGVPLEGIKVAIGMKEEYTDERGVTGLNATEGPFTIFIDGKEQGYDSINVSLYCSSCGSLVMVVVGLDRLPVPPVPPAPDPTPPPTEPIEVPALSPSGTISLGSFLAIAGGVRVIRKREGKKVKKEEM